MNYAEKKQIVITTLADTARIKAEAISLKQATAFNAVLLVSDLPTTASYDNLFSALKEDCKQAGFKFAGTPLHKACNVVKTLKFDYPQEWRDIAESADCRKEKTAEERLFFAVTDWLKAHKLTFSATIGKIAEALNPQESDSQESDNGDLQAVIAYIKSCGIAELNAVISATVERTEEVQNQAKVA